jgi:hypothetical protein
MRPKTAKYYSSLPINFCDIHPYSKRARLEQYVSNDYNNKKCIIGECGYPVNLNINRRSSNEVKIAEKFLTNSIQKGYSGCLIWDHDFTSEENKEIIIQRLKEFVRVRDNNTR